MSGQDLRAATMEGLVTLAEWACGVGNGDVPPAALRKAALIIADNTAAAVAARDEPEVIALHDRLGPGQPQEATIFRGGRVRTDRYSAALANGTAGCWCELDEGYRGAPSHAALYLLPALLAEAEAADLPVVDVLRLTAVAYEVAGRIARTWVFPAASIHPHPAFAAVSAAVATALARRSDPATLLDALTAASTFVNVGNYDHAIRGALVRNAWSGMGTMNGMRSVDLAECGIAGLIDSPYEIFTVVLGVEPRPQHLTDALGVGDWAITQGYHKVHGCCQSTHSAVEAALELRRQLPAAAIERVVLETHRPSMSNPTPETTLGARFSFEHVVATALVHGHAGPDAFATATLDAPEVERLRLRIDLRRFEPVLPRPNDRPARMTAYAADGRSFTAECLSAPGGPDQPFAEAVVLDKADALTSAVYPSFGPTMTALCDQDPALLALGWRALVDRFTRPG